MKFKELFTNESRMLRAADLVTTDVFAWADELEFVSDEELATSTARLRDNIADGLELDDVLIEAFALVREATRRELGFQHHRVQIAGAVVLHHGLIAEMRTGEGKTITALPAAFLRSLEGEGVHVVTANEYLAARDAELAGKILGRLGTTVGLVLTSDQSIISKQQAYAADITYGTAQEIGFDYLRDNVADTAAELVQRGFNYVIVDEIDSILIDDAHTPLIISSPGDIDAAGVRAAASVAERLHVTEHYELDLEEEQIALNEPGWTCAEEMYGIDMTDITNARRVAQLRNALVAKELKRRDIEYLIHDGKVQMIDQGTGRVLDGRRWSWGLHQAIEAKEGLELLADAKTIASVTLQYLFGSYNVLSGMTGTAMSSVDEFQSTYDLDIVRIPTNEKMIREDAQDVLWPSADSKHGAVAAEALSRSANGQPVLIGTPDVAESEQLSEVLNERGIEHELLNAKRHMHEAAIIAQAGRPGRVTVATNMAGRGVDILLGGDPERLAAAEIAERGDDISAAEIDAISSKWREQCRHDRESVLGVGGLAVIGCARHDSRRIDEQLRGRAGRQGEPGFSQFHLSLDDDLLRPLADGPLAAARRLGKPLEGRVVSKAVARAQEQRDGIASKGRRELYLRDSLVGLQRDAVYARRRELLNLSDAESCEAALREVAAISAEDVCAQFAGDGEFGVEDQHGAISMLSKLIRVSAADADRVRHCANRSELEDVLDELFDTHISERRELLGEQFVKVVSSILVSSIDTAWIKHLDSLESLSESMMLWAMAQHSPGTQWGVGIEELYQEMQLTAANTAIMWALGTTVTMSPAAPKAADTEDTGDSSEPVGDADADADS